MAKMDVFTISAQFGAENIDYTVRVWLPDGYGVSAKRYPVLYMQDGQNLFGDELSFCGGWHIDKTIDKMMRQGFEGCILVGVDNNENRFNEYCPDFSIEGRALVLGTACGELLTAPCGKYYADFLAQKLKPAIDARYLTKPQREYTAVGGSSMGGLISVYTALTYPELYGGLLAMSPCLYIFEESAFDKWLYGKKEAVKNMRAAVYVGGQGYEADFVRGTRKLAQFMEQYAQHSYLLVRRDFPHNEKAWSAVLQPLLAELFVF